MSITFTNGLNSVAVDAPEFGYECQVRMPLIFSERMNKTVGVFDAGAIYDNRFCMCRFLLNAADSLAFVTFFNDVTKGRGNDVTLSLGATASGFFPFGPDLGDIGDFTVRLLTMKPSGQLLEPLRWWRLDATFLLISGPSPAYSLPSSVDYGNIQIGTIQNLRYPEGTFESEAIYSVENIPLSSPGAEVVDLGNAADSHRVAFTLNATQAAMANLVNYLVTTPRDSVNKTYNPFNIITQSNQFIYGIQNSGSGTYSSHLLSNVLSIKHNNFDQFDLDLNLRMVA